MSTRENIRLIARAPLYDFSKVSPSDFLQSDLFQKNNKKIHEYLQYQTV